ncbi:hypothetical protein GLOIN_2v1696354 [Rhizophagus irregularis DAOM 181602=DAOM 197198]|uniref:F-box domain-containing protein n=5 Tax=Rhizophagus irregularis TaxID=588596 RepID=A0A2P4PAI1_RHIID|nr:hypothetical protein GLOIN_2v1696354 [Rhizophagus irregularis DAOM 181602=DAOM 197198]POG62406.1 hypothetical protein GLOIN_2v1696354 [Rhizophagus irregularis DAOM 181602=DAOM 197198]|eukprot:XP_025169272.1 hypothetical protein GLOIN_2v1696354 [Rhizophagus irregularis DAOM 181602=DAOM 197198]
MIDRLNTFSIVHIMLPKECIKDIFESIYDDYKTLYSCLLVNRLFCRIIVPILWRNTWYFGYNDHIIISLSRTYFSCLTDESKELIKNNNIDISPPTQHSPLFNYIEYCQYIYLQQIRCMSHAKLLQEEFIKLFLTRCTKIVHLDFPYCPRGIENIYLSSSLSHLCELHCDTITSSEFFFELSKTCHKIQRLYISTCDDDIEGLATLIKVQHELQFVYLRSDDSQGVQNERIGEALAIQANTLMHVRFCGQICIPYNAFYSFINLKRLELELFEEIDARLSDAAYFPKLKVLEIKYNKLTPFEVYTNLIGKTEGTLVRIHWNYINTPPTTLSLRKYIQTVINNCPNLEFVTIWYQDSILDDLKQLLISSLKLKGLKIIFYCTSDIDKLFNLLADKAPLSLTILCLDEVNYYHNSLLSIENLDKLLKMWIDRPPLLLYIWSQLRQSLELLKVMDGYLNDDVLNDFDYLYSLDCVEVIRKSWEIEIPYGYI